MRNRIRFGCMSCVALLLTIGSSTSWSANIDSETCSCPCFGDPQCDEITDISDVVLAIDVAFQSGTPVFDQDCTVSRTDVSSCNGVTDVFDVLFFVTVAFQNGNTNNWCDPGCAIGNPAVPEFCQPGIVVAGNSVVVESKSVAKLATNVTVTVTIVNDVELIGLTAPFELREVSGGAFPAANFSFTEQGRLGSSALNSGFKFKRELGVPEAGNSCSGPVAQSFAADNPVDFVSPDAVFYSAAATGATGLAAGADGTGTESFLFTFDVNNADGVFEIDTCCVTPSNHILFIGSGSNSCIIPSFTKGVITVGNPEEEGACNAIPFTDVNCDGVTDVFDVLVVVGVSFQNAPDPVPCCVGAP